MFKKFLIYFSLYVVTLWIIISVFLLTPSDSENFPVIRLIIISFASVLLIKYFVYMIISPWHDVFVAWSEYKNRKIYNYKTYRPRVTVLVPAWNEESGIITTLQSLINSSYKKLEIIVIDNASTDDTAVNVVSFIKKYKKLEKFYGENIKIIYTREDQKGKGYALNKGIAMATGEIIVSIDADCFVPKETIQNFVNYFKDDKVMAAVGNVKIGNTKSIIEVIQYLEFLFSFYFKKCDSLLGSIYIIGGAAGAFRRKIFDDIGGYSVTNITEDINLSFRIQHEGLKIIYAEQAIVYTEGATDFTGLIQQRLRWKKGRLETFLEYRKMFFSKDKNHKKVLSWFVLPLAVFGDMQLFLELFFILFVYIYSYLTKDYSSFISGIIVVSSMFAVQILFDVSEKRKKRLFLLAPIGWLLLYASTFVEFRALIKSLWGYIKKEEVVWQQWNRKGVFSQFTQNKTIPVATVTKKNRD